MHPLVATAKKKIGVWIAILTVGGILLMVGYILILIPALTGGLVGWALGVTAGPTLAMILYHDLVLMKRLWKNASDFLEQGPDQKDGIPAEEALKNMLEFPLYMPLFGLLAWVVGGIFAGVGAWLGTGGMIKLPDVLVLVLGVCSAAVVITIFQFYEWRKIIDPIVGAIIHRKPEVLDGQVKVKRFPLKSTLMATLLLLIVLMMYIALMAAYRQAGSALQEYVGKFKAERMVRLEGRGEVDWSRMQEPSYRAQAESGLKKIEPEPFPLSIMLVEQRDGVWRELVTDQPFGEMYPELVLGIMDKELERAASRPRMKENERIFASVFNNFGPAVVVFTKIDGAAGPGTCYLILSYPWDNYKEGLTKLTWYSLLLMVVVIVITWRVVTVIARDISVPVSRLVEFTQDMALGKIHEDVFYHANDEVGDLSLSIRHMSRQLGDVLFRVQNAARSLDQATGAIRQSAESVKDGAKLQGQAIDDVASAMSEMDMNISGIAENVEILSASTEESSSSIFEMGAAIKKINESVDILNQSIGDVSSSINEMTAALDQVAENVSNLSAVTEETASSMAQMDASIHQVEQNTKETAEWSESVIHDAEAGVDAVSRVTDGMHQIAEVVHAAQTVIERLGGRVEAIGKIVKVIDDIANQTNLLALNAAIIAAQAGEHGRGFAVVADEIKQLAERTSGSTREIHQLIRGVQGESRQAVGAVEDGARAVEEGVKLTDQASSSLAKILDSTRLATERVQGVARTTVEQAESSRLVSQAIDRVADMVNQISVAASQQSRGGTLILKATEEMKAASLQVKRNAEEQLQGSKLITKSIENITDMLYSINTAQQEQKRSSHQVVQLMDRIKVVGNTSVESASRLSEVVDALTVEAETLREEMRRFRWINNNGTGPDHG